MPMLFAISGLLASGYIRAGFTLRTLRRATGSYYLYVIWLMTYAILALAAAPGMPYSRWNLESLVGNLGDPRTPLWFVFALAVYGLVLPAFARLPIWVPLTLLAMLSISTSLMPADPAIVFWVRIFQYAFIFALGVYATPLLHWCAEKSNWWVAPVALISATLVLGALPSERGVLQQTILLVADILSVAGAISLVALICQFRFVSRAFTRMKGRTLEIYVLHIPALWIVSLIPVEIFDGSKSIRWFWPILGTSLIVVISLGAAWALRKVGAGFMFEPAAWLSGKKKVAEAHDLADGEAAQLPVGGSHFPRNSA
jgi:hypothetical protein